MPGSVEYMLPAEFTHTGAGPDNVGAGNAFTVTFFIVAEAAVQLLTFV
jgi:hypothetical protein